jgi:hypothetical protein
MGTQHSLWGKEGGLGRWYSVGRLKGGCRGGKEAGEVRTAAAIIRIGLQGVNRNAHNQ